MLLFVGDPHGNLVTVKETVFFLKSEVIFFLGDQCLENPIDLILSNISSLVYFILNNHNSDHPHWPENHLSAWEQCLNCKTVEVGGQKIAELGGVFIEGIWHLHTGVKWKNRECYIHHTPPEHRFKNRLLLGHWTSIFPEDFKKLLNVGNADILITHQAPECHQYGFKGIG